MISRYSIDSPDPAVDMTKPVVCEHFDIPACWREIHALRARVAELEAKHEQVTPQAKVNWTNR